MNMIPYLLAILIFSVSNFLAQINVESNIDSLRISQKYQLLFGENLELKIPIYTVGKITDPYELIFESTYFDRNNFSHNQFNFLTMQRVKSEINQSMAIYRKGQNKYHLGVVSDVLGYVSTAAAAGLAAYHVYKYRKKYGIK